MTTHKDVTIYDNDCILVMSNLIVASVCVQVSRAKAGVYINAIIQGASAMQGVRATVFVLNGFFTTSYS